jgi:hypothetical protein
MRDGSETRSSPVHPRPEVAELAGGPRRTAAAGPAEPEDRVARRPCGVVHRAVHPAVRSDRRAVDRPDRPLPRDLPLALETQRVAEYVHSNWWGSALIVVNALLAPVAEEIVFRGFLLPRCGTPSARRHLRQRTAVHAVPPAPAVEHARRAARGHVRCGLPGPAASGARGSLSSHTAPSVLIITVVLLLVL